MKGIPVRLSIFAAVGAFALFTLAASAQQQQQIRTPKQTRLPQNPDFSKLEVQTLKVQGNVYLLAGAGVLEDILGLRGTTPIDPRSPK